MIRFMGYDNDQPAEANVSVVPAVPSVSVAPVAPVTAPAFSAAPAANTVAPATIADVTAATAAIAVSSASSVLPETYTAPLSPGFYPEFMECDSEEQMLLTSQQ